MTIYPEDLIFQTVKQWEITVDSTKSRISNAACQSNHVQKTGSLTEPHDGGSIIELLSDIGYGFTGNAND
jgi:hypothetical protein